MANEIERQGKLGGKGGAERPYAKLSEENPKKKKPQTRSTHLTTSLGIEMERTLWGGGPLRTNRERERGKGRKFKGSGGYIWGRSKNRILSEKTLENNIMRIMGKGEMA